MQSEDRGINMVDIFFKIDQFRRIRKEAGEKPPHVLTMDSDDIQWMMNPDGSRLVPIFHSEDETDKLMAKVPCIVGRYKDVYIIQSVVDVKDKNKRQKAYEVLDIIGDAIYNEKLMDDTKLSIVRDMLNYYNEEMISGISDVMRGKQS